MEYWGYKKEPDHEPRGLICYYIAQSHLWHLNQYLQHSTTPLLRAVAL